ncbi:AAA family ATPase [Curtobacterium sp. MCBD17_019]|uniref:AAA family ATPase n=1 Tax=Curtobacterium sp. MCBD17_019 TaxID=2175669 RepID=UPI0011B65AF1|nr:AAA family ATPase [Curtobacterium sp. MCBD17_019]
MSRRDVVNAFQPSTEVDDPSRFAGRTREVQGLTEALHVDGSVPLIYGQRGLGKSSLALQATRIAQGDPELLAQMNLSHLQLDPDQYFLTFHVTCTDQIDSTEALLQLLVNAVEAVDMDSGDPQTARRLVDRTSRRRLTIKFFEVESVKRFETEAQRANYLDLTLEEKLTTICELLTRHYGQPVLFVIDELDRMQNSGGLAAFLKANSTENLKFLLVGIAANHSELLADHQSLARKLAPIEVRTMAAAELRGIIDRVENYLHEIGHPLVFTNEAKSKLVQISGGFPWFVHVVGQTALLTAFDEKDEVVSLDAVDSAVHSLVHNRFAQEYSDKYQQAVRDSVPREQLLRLFAEWQDSDIPTSDIYRMASSLGVSGPSTYRGHLTSEAHGSILYAPVFQQRGVLRFRDEMFKVYVRIRPSLFRGVSEQVREIYDKY